MATTKLPTSPLPDKRILFAGYATAALLGRISRMLAQLALARSDAGTSPSSSPTAGRGVRAARRKVGGRWCHFDKGNKGRRLEAAGVLNGSMRSRGNSWGLHMPLFCPDGAVVVYAWKRQLVGQAGASSVDRTRLALKGLTDQKKHVFPHIEDDPVHNGDFQAGKKLCRAHKLFMNHIAVFNEERNLSDDPVHNGDLQAGKKLCRAQKLSMNHIAVFNEERNLSDVLIQLEKEAPQMYIFTYQRLDWLKRSSSLSMLASENFSDTSKEQVFHASNNLRTGSLGAVAVEQIAVIELLVPSVFSAIISLHPAGS